MYDPASQTWTGTSSLGTPRESHTATLLPNGNVLVAGGDNTTSGGLMSAELYDPASGTWTATGSLATPGGSNTATLLPNGKVLVAGGYNGGSIFERAELYDPASGTWTATGSLAITRYAHTATLLPNGKVLVAGGGSNSGDPVRAELYDPASGTWSNTGSLIATRSDHTATLLPNGKVLVAGGTGTSGVLTSAELYDPANGTWTTTGSLGAARFQHSATLLPNGKVLVACGRDSSFQSPLASAELYDPASGTWTTTGSLATARFYGHTATLLPNGKVLVAGGIDNISTSVSFPTSTELYDSASGTWTATGNIGTARSSHTATLLPSGNVLVAGGERRQRHSRERGTLRWATDTARLAQHFHAHACPYRRSGAHRWLYHHRNRPKEGYHSRDGPSLNGVGVTLSDPTLELHQGNTTLATNDNWKIDDQTGQSQEATIRATTIPPPGNDLESALVATLTPGPYTAILAGKNGGTGVGLVEVYDLAQGANSKLANISTRGFVDSGDNVMIGGLIVGGGTGGGTATVIVRALGPSVPVPGALGDPTLELHDGSGTTIATNDNWKINDQTDESQEAAIRATTIPPTNDLESALVATLAPGNYTAIVRGKNNTTGVGLVEVYNL